MIYQYAIVVSHIHAHTHTHTHTYISTHTYAHTHLREMLDVAVLDSYGAE